MTALVLGQVGSGGWTTLHTLAVLGAAVLIVLFVVIFISTRYKRCPSNRILVIFGKVSGDRASKCIHGGGAFVVPLVQDYAYLSLEPLAIEIPPVAVSTYCEPV